MNKKAIEKQLKSVRLPFCLFVGIGSGILASTVVIAVERAKIINRIQHTQRHEHRALNVLKLIAPMEAVGPSLVRVGGNEDGGYVMLNEFPDDSVAYSFGIGGDISWDADIAKKNIEVYMYDPTIDALPYNGTYHSDRHFHFFKTGICGKNNNFENLKTFEQLLKINGHENEKNIILKIDTEGAEWDSLPDVSEETMERCNQIVVEFHRLNQMIDDEKYKKICDLLKKINKTHQSVHLHGNNCDSYEIIDGVPIPNVIEVTYARKSNHKFTKNYKCYPIKGLDKPNTPIREDYFLGFCGMQNE
jgi:hypothetical protein